MSYTKCDPTKGTVGYRFKFESCNVYKLKCQNIEWWKCAVQCHTVFTDLYLFITHFFDYIEMGKTQNWFEPLSYFQVHESHLWRLDNVLYTEKVGSFQWKFHFLSWKNTNVFTECILISYRTGNWKIFEMQTDDCEMQIRNIPMEFNIANFIFMVYFYIEPFFCISGKVDKALYK